MTLCRWPRVPQPRQLGALVGRTLQAICQSGSAMEAAFLHALQLHLHLR